MKLGKNMKDALDFAKRHPEEWHSYSKDKATKSAIKRLQELELVQVNEFSQFKYVSKGN